MKEISKQGKAGISDSTALWYVIVLVGAGALYAITCAPAVLWQDSGLFVYRIWHNDIEGNLGLALAHPLYIMIGIAVKYIIPFGDMAHRVNLISAVFGAIAVANLFLLLRLWLGRTVPAVIGAITLAVSWNFWQHAVVAEVYTLYIAQLFIELIVLLQYSRTKRVGYLYLLAFFNGLAIANHICALFALACYTVFLVVLLVRKQIGLKHLVILVLLWVIGAAPYEYLIIKNIILSGEVWTTMASAIFGSHWQGAVFNASISMKIVLENIVFILLNFPTPNLVFFFVGLWVLRKATVCRSLSNIILALLVMHFVFAFRYTVVDRYVFFLPFYCLTSVLIGLGVDVFLKRYKHKALFFAELIFEMLPIIAYCVTPAVAKKAYKSLGSRRQRPYRDEYKYFLQPWKTGYRGAERFASEALEQVENNAIIYAPSTDVHSLLYMQEVKGLREDVKIISSQDVSIGAPALTEDTIKFLIEDTDIYVVSPVSGYCPDYIIDNYDFAEAGLIYRIVKKE